MKAIILAAGVGKRLKPVTDSTPKCLLKIGTETLIEKYIRLLRENGIRDIVIVVGHLKDLIISRLKASGEGIRFIYNPDYIKGSVTSLYMAKDELKTECLLMDADVYFEEALLQKLVKSRNENCFLIDSTSPNTGEEMVIAVNNKRVAAIERNLAGKFDSVGEGVGFVKLSRSSAQSMKEILVQFIAKGRVESEYEECLNELVKVDYFGYEKVDGLKWTEIDFKEDIKRANRLAMGA